MCFGVICTENDLQQVKLNPFFEDYTQILFYCELILKQQLYGHQDYEFSQWNKPTELYAVQVCPNCAGATFPEQLTKSTPESFNKIVWNENEKESFQFEIVMTSLPVGVRQG